MAKHIHPFVMIHAAKIERAAKRLSDAALRFAILTGADIVINVDGEEAMSVKMLDKLEKRKPKKTTIN